jgi:Glycosyl transferase family 2
MRKYYYSLLARYLSLFVLPQNSVVEIDPVTPQLINLFENGAVSFRDAGKALTPDRYPRIVEFESLPAEKPDYIMLSGLVHQERDIQALLAAVHTASHPTTRLIVTYYSTLWRPFMRLASWLGLRQKTPELNWLAHQDIENLLYLENFELIRREGKVILPIWIPLLSNFANRYLAPLPVFRLFCLVNVAVARPLHNDTGLGDAPSVSIVIPARNEAGSIEEIMRRIPKMGSDDEVIFIEGHSTDDTWSTIQRVYAEHGATRRMQIAQQSGKGKGDAVRKGFGMARNEILMILDADMTVPPEDLTKFYRAIAGGRGEFISGSRLVYPMEKRAMPLFNLLGNKFFATAFAFVLGQRFKDTLCGTKVLSRGNYQKLAANRGYFGDFDPFGDFDLIFGASRMCLKTVEVPIIYAERKYGKTNISRLTHGTMLLAMLLFAARRIKFI